VAASFQSLASRDRMPRTRRTRRGAADLAYLVRALPGADGGGDQAGASGVAGRADGQTSALGEAGDDRAAAVGTSLRVVHHVQNCHELSDCRMGLARCFG